MITSTVRKMGAVLELLKQTSLRIGEACRLKWTDLDVKHNTIAINEPEKKRFTANVRGQPKTDDNAELSAQRR